ncbi:MAG: hypothetical protein GOV02_00860 [Candidatus Aenigmarchaeota archaeon]|nr:hypothetical protein [Candidatus Aenigmarchaeota archaeon]
MKCEKKVIVDGSSVSTEAQLSSMGLSADARYVYAQLDAYNAQNDLAKALIYQKKSELREMVGSVKYNQLISE